MHSLKNIDFSTLIAKEKNARMRVRLMALSHIQQGVNRTQAARYLHVSRRMVNEWVKRFNQDGLDGLKEKPRSGRPCALSAEQLQTLKIYIESHAIKPDGGRLKGTLIIDYVKQEFDITYGLTNIYRLLHQLGFSWITSRSKHPKQSQEAQDEFKKLQIETIKLIPGHVTLDKVDIWFQDEARIGQQNTTTRLWANKGSRPRAVKQQQFEYAHLFGAVCPATGETEALITPVVNKDIMRQHLQLISNRTQLDRYAVVIMDGAGWHTDDIAHDLDNVSIIKLPPYSPELNPIEQVWQWLRQNELANQCFDSYEDIVIQCSRAWNNFISDKEKVIKLCARNWAQVGN
ncbi:IS630 family transposase [Paraglaciecola sp. L3A3]|uniref:IS630 family transposase n=1 Tax=Paraglaciecola sp. L3A3 TaxID=2686358 RepID=UPI00131E39E1|nr:IS630 family transposase [Paraglaciecola sp. L3A3]